jgi:hypothetical protein
MAAAGAVIVAAGAWLYHVNNPPPPPPVVEIVSARVAVNLVGPVVIVRVRSRSNLEAMRGTWDCVDRYGHLVPWNSGSGSGRDMLWEVIETMRPGDRAERAFRVPPGVECDSARVSVTDVRFSDGTAADATYRPLAEYYPPSMRRN